MSEDAVSKEGISTEVNLEAHEADSHNENDTQNTNASSGERNEGHTVRNEEEVEHKKESELSSKSPKKEDKEHTHDADVHKVEENVAAVQKEETTEHKAESPKHKAESPKHKAESPKHKAKSPKHSNESPKHKVESPKHLKQSPAHKAEVNPVHDQVETTEHKPESPSNKAEVNPVHDQVEIIEHKPESPTHKAESPTHKSESPKHKTEEKPAHTESETIIVEENDVNKTNHKPEPTAHEKVEASPLIEEVKGKDSEEHKIITSPRKADSAKDEKANSEETKLGDKSEQVNLEIELPKIIERKRAANAFTQVEAKTHPNFKESLNEAIKQYNEILTDIKKIEEKGGIEKDPKIKDFNKEKILIMSNLALSLKKLGFFRESISCDREIIFRDPKFDKSYARLIDSYMMINDLDNANRFYSDLTMIFSEDVVRKYPEVLTKLTEENKKADDNLKNFSRKSKKKEVEEKKKDEEEKKRIEEQHLEKVEKNKGSRWIKAFLGITLFLGSSIGLFLLFKYRNRFHRP